ncbi:hypothetical protein NDU88_005177 [Pleurodeles waltl]|uniref:Uncharacterized protein n=1 Tax=Pleurodeles waltl TaxID=8319 RepID=A0AAV7PEL9_PLEWA|nr:hypothetical protein NDU88_005177 [Pleurodeles waltl]
MIECPGGTFECIMLLRRDDVSNQEENARSGEGERTQKEDMDSGERRNPDWRGTTGDATSRDEEEALGSHILEKVN